MFYHRTPGKWVSLLLAGSIATYASQAMASGFQLHEQSAALLGEFYAGSAAVAEDASTNYYNPAGLTYLTPLEISFGAVNVSTYSKFTGTVDANFGTDRTGSASGGASRLVPNMHMAYRINEKFAVGFSATAPFGLATSWGPDSVVQEQIVKSELKTYNLGPSIAYQFNSWLSFAAGIDAQYAKLRLDVKPTISGGSQSIIKAESSSWAWGYHGGILAQTPIGTRIGLNVRSDIYHDFRGDSKSDTSSSKTKGNARFPWVIDLSLYHDFNNGFTALGTASYTNWSSIQKLKIENLSLPGTTATTTVSDPLNFKSTWGYFAALRYQLNDSIMLKAGTGYDQTPTNNTDRPLYMPDESRWIVSAGFRWVPRSAPFATIDVGYAHLIPEDAAINKFFLASTATGEVKGGANLFGVQFSLKAAPLVMPEQYKKAQESKMNGAQTKAM